MIAWESYGNRWRLHPGVADTYVGGPGGVLYKDMDR